MDIHATEVNSAQIYRFLAQSMRYPDQSWLNDTYLEALVCLLDELDWHDDLREIRKSSENFFDFFDALQVEHTRLFINAIPNVIAPPYASIYMDNQRQLYGAFAESTRTYYREMGFDLAEDENLPDHLVNELEFLALLQKENVKDAEFFLTKFFRPWFPVFRDRVLLYTNHSFYKTIIKLIDFFTKEDQ